MKITSVSQLYMLNEKHREVYVDQLQLIDAHSLRYLCFAKKLKFMKCNVQLKFDVFISCLNRVLNVLELDSCTFEDSKQVDLNLNQIVYNLIIKNTKFNCLPLVHKLTIDDLTIEKNEIRTLKLIEDLFEREEKESFLQISGNLTADRQVQTELLYQICDQQTQTESIIDNVQTETQLKQQQQLLKAEDLEVQQDNQNQFDQLKQNNQEIDSNQMNPNVNLNQCNQNTNQLDQFISDSQNAQLTQSIPSIVSLRYLDQSESKQQIYEDVSQNRISEEDKQQLLAELKENLVCQAKNLQQKYQVSPVRNKIQDLQNDVMQIPSRMDAAVMQKVKIEESSSKPQVDLGQKLIVESIADQQLNKVLEQRQETNDYQQKEDKIMLNHQLNNKENQKQILVQNLNSNTKEQEKQQINEFYNDGLLDAKLLVNHHQVRNQKKQYDPLLDFEVFSDIPKVQDVDQVARKYTDVESEIVKQLLLQEKIIKKIIKKKEKDKKKANSGIVKEIEALLKSIDGDE